MPPSLRAEHPPNPRTLPNGPVPTPIHRSAWKGNSRNFGFRGFSEVVYPCYPFRSAAAFWVRLVLTAAIATTAAASSIPAPTRNPVV